MKFETVLTEGILIRRYNRFLADVRLNDDTVITAHCPNSGSMKTCKEPGWKVLLSRSDNPKRKLKYTWEMVHNGKCWIGINTMVPNRIAVEAIQSGVIPELSGYGDLKTERRYGENSRIDILLSEGDRHCYVEVKNVTLVESDGYYKFPDAVTTRGRKHLQELMDMVNKGRRAMMLFVIQRNDGTIFKPAVDIDPLYGKTLREAYERGVEILPYLADVSPREIKLKNKIKFDLE